MTKYLRCIKCGKNIPIPEHVEKGDILTCSNCGYEYVYTGWESRIWKY